jgi:hypothetical protein
MGLLTKLTGTPSFSLPDAKAAAISGSRRGISMTLLSSPH